MFLNLIVYYIFLFDWFLTFIGDIQLLFQDLAQELILHKNRLYQITQICTQLQDYSDVNHLAVVLLQQLVHVSEELKDIEEQLNHRLALLQVQTLIFTDNSIFKSFTFYSFNFS